MKIKNLKHQLLIVGIFFFITLIFFYPLFKKNVPFPGDLLIGEYQPYSSYSYFGFNPGSYPNKGQDFDVIRLIYPAKEFSLQELKKGNIPLWNPYNFSGNPHMASMQSGTFYPVNLLFFLLPFVAAWAFYILFQPFLAGFFTFLLLREYKLSIQGSFFGGIVFAFSSFMTVWLEYGNLGHSFLWLPLILYVLSKQFTSPTPMKAIALSLILSVSILAGYIQMSLYVFIFSFAYVFFHFIFIERKKTFKNITSYIVIFLLPLFVCAIQLLPSIELYFNSSRSPYLLGDFLNLLVPGFHIVTLFVPDFFGNPATRNYWLNGTYIERVSYIGIVPLLFVSYLFFGKLTKYMWFYVVSALVVALFVFNTFIGNFLYTLYLPPIISTGVPSRMMFLFCFSLSVLAGFGMDEFSKNKNIKRIIVISAIFTALFSGFWAFTLFSPELLPHETFLKNLSISKRNLIIPSALLIVGLLGLWLSAIYQNRRKIILSGLILVTAGDLFLFFHKITPFAPVETVYPKTELIKYLQSIQGIDRVWEYGSGYIQTNIQTHEKIFGANGYDALHLRRYGEFISASKTGKMNLPPPRSEAELAGGYGESDLRTNTSRQRIMNIIGIKYVLNKTSSISQKPDTQTFPEKIYSLLWQKGGWQVYQNREALARIYTVSNVFTEINREKIIARLMSKNFDAKNSVVIEESLQNQKLEKDSNAHVKLISYKPNSISLKTETKTDMFLVISDNFASGWKAYVDNQEVKIYRANYAFRAILLKKGNKNVVFVYKPLSFEIGKYISIVTLLSMLLYLLYVSRRKERGSNEKS